MDLFLRELMRSQGASLEIPLKQVVGSTSTPIAKRRKQHCASPTTSSDMIMILDRAPGHGYNGEEFDCMTNNSSSHSSSRRSAADRWEESFPSDSCLTQLHAQQQMHRRSSTSSLPSLAARSSSSSSSSSEDRHSSNSLGSPLMMRRRASMSSSSASRSMDRLSPPQRKKDKKQEPSSNQNATFSPTRLVERTRVPNLLLKSGDNTISPHMPMCRWSESSSSSLLQHMPLASPPRDSRRRGFVELPAQQMGGGIAPRRSSLETAPKKPEKRLSIEGLDVSKETLSELANEFANLDSDRDEEEGEASTLEENQTTTPSRKTVVGSSIITATEHLLQALEKSKSQMPRRSSSMVDLVSCGTSLSTYLASSQASTGCSVSSNASCISSSASLSSMESFMASLSKKKKNARELSTTTKSPPSPPSPPTSLYDHLATAASQNLISDHEDGDEDNDYVVTLKPPSQRSKAKARRPKPSRRSSVA